ncbi:hypothetical protein [Burkholderia pseudomallei]|uniref:hypothetical protein n=1 Tax=Burkholderia pseudomallei TaxID=28450 RepID=UPI001AAF623B|nr:hypothetical protein [Burkholderia pseudomallei]MBO3050964.1 hypothetical protein [Burkholderia pseudomallei]
MFSIENRADDKNRIVRIRLLFDSSTPVDQLTAVGRPFAPILPGVLNRLRIGFVSASYRPRIGFDAHCEPDNGMPTTPTPGRHCASQMRDRRADARAMGIDMPGPSMPRRCRDERPPCADHGAAMPEPASRRIRRSRDASKAPATPNGMVARRGSKRHCPR